MPLGSEVDLDPGDIVLDGDLLTTTVLRPFFREHPGEPVPEEKFWTLWCKGILIEADTPTIRMGAAPSGLTSTHLHHPPRGSRFLDGDLLPPPKKGHSTHQSWPMYCGQTAG